MTKNRQAIIHAHSNVYNNGVAKAPTSGLLEKGEIAVNYNDTEPSLFIENNSGDLVQFVSKNYIDTQLSGKSNTGHTHPEYANQNAFGKVTDGTRTYTATATTDTLKIQGSGNTTVALNSTTGQITISTAAGSDSATTEDGHYSPSTTSSTVGSANGFIKTVVLDSKKHVISATTGTAVTSETQLSTATTGSGNAITNLTVSNHQITMVKDKTFSETGHKHSGADITSGTVGIAYLPTATTVANSATTIPTNKAVYEALAGKSDTGHTHPDYATTGGTYPSMTVGSATSATSATTAANAAKVNNHTVEADVPSGAKFTDSATTEDGHYSPTATSTTVGSANAFVKTIAIDSKNHVISATTGTAITSETQLSTATTGSGNAVTNITVSNHKITYEKGLTFSETGHKHSGGDITSGTVGLAYLPTATSVTSDATTIPTTKAAYTELQKKLGTGDTAADSSKLGGVAASGYAQTSGSYANLSAGTATNATKVNNHTVESDVPSGAVFTDTATTQTGHYSPTTAAATGGSATAGNFLKTVAFDSKGHYISATTGTAITSIPTASSVTNDSTKIPTNAAVYAALQGKSDTGHTHPEYAQTGGTYSAMTVGSASTAGDAATVDGHSVATDVPAGAVFSDTATTQTGHYSGGAAASTAGTSTAGSFLKTVAFDNKGHYVSASTGTAITSETQLSTASTGTGNAVTNITVSNHKITYEKGETFTTSSDVQTMIEEQVSSSVNYKGATATLPTASAKVGDMYVASAEISIPSGKSATSGATTAEKGDYIIARNSGTTYVWDVIEKNITGAVTSTDTLGANNLVVGNGSQTVKTTSVALSSVALTGGTYSGMTVGNATAATSAATAGDAATVNSHQVNADVPSGAVFTDTATTQTGHYSPSAATATGGSATAGRFLKTVAFDSKGHYISASTGTALTSHATHAISVTNGSATTTSGEITFVESVASAGTATSGNPQISTVRKTVTIPAAVTEDTVSGWGFTKNEGTITGINMNGGSKGTSGVVDLGTVITSETQLSTATTGTGNAVTNITVSNHQITMVKDKTFSESGHKHSGADITSGTVGIAYLPTATSVTNVATTVPTNKAVYTALSGKADTGGTYSSMTVGTATNATKVNNHTVNADVPSNAVFTDNSTTQAGHYDPSATGAQTYGESGKYIETLKVDSKGHLAGYTTAVFVNTDSATTETGHYAPSTATATAGTATAGTFLKTIALDSKGHYISATTATAIQSLPTASTVVNDSTTIPTNAAVYNALTGKMDTDAALPVSRLDYDAPLHADDADSATTANVANKTVSALTINYKNGDASTGTATFNGSANTTVNISSLTVSSVSAFTPSMTDAGVIYAVSGASRSGVNYVSGAANITIPTTKDVVCVTGITADRTVSMGSGMSDGQSIHVIFKSNSDATARTLTLNSTFTVLTESDTITTSTDNGYAEMNILFVNGQYLVRAM